jgi:glucokinase
MALHIVTGDIGGTNARLQLVACNGDDCRVRRFREYASQTFADFDTILRDFLAVESPGSVSAACLAVAGPVETMGQGQRVQVTNLPWVLDSAALATGFSIRHVFLINDFQAVGHGIGVMPEASFALLQTGKPVLGGTRAVLGAGTGLGQAILVPRPSGDEVLATEGGHVDFGPTSELELELARWLITTRGRACYEDVLSGPGLSRLYEFLRARRFADESVALARPFRQVILPLLLPRPPCSTRMLWPPPHWICLFVYSVRRQAIWRWPRVLLVVFILQVELPLGLLRDCAVRIFCAPFATRAAIPVGWRLCRSV